MRRSFLFFVLLVFAVTAGRELSGAPRNKVHRTVEREQSEKKQRDTENDNNRVDEALDSVPDEELDEEKLKAVRAEKYKQFCEVPYISLYYVNPSLIAGEELKIRFYVTDWYQSEYRLGDKSHRFNVTLSYGDVHDESRKMTSLKKSDLPAGDHEISIGTLPAGDYRIRLEAVDAQGRHSHVLFHEIRVIESDEAKIKAAETYMMKEADLKKYKISNKGDYGIFKFYTKDYSGTFEDFAAEHSAGIPADKYLVLAHARDDFAMSGSWRNQDPGAAGAYDHPQPEIIPDLGNWKKCKVVYGENYDAEKVEKEAVQTGLGLNSFLADVRKKGFRKVVLLPGVYRISHENSIEVPSGLTLDLNGATLKLNQFTGHSACMVTILHGYDTHVENGILEGDYFEHNYKESTKNSEWVCGISISGNSRFCSAERLLIRYITGYAVTGGFSGSFVDNVALPGFYQGTIDRETGEHIEDVPGLVVSEYFDISSIADISDYLVVARYLGYQGSGAAAWNLRFHFYDENEKYLGTIDGWQYRRVLIPRGAYYLRVTAYSWDEAAIGDLEAYLLCVPQNCWIKNIFVTNARCVGMAPSAMYNYRFENNTIVRSGESGAFCAFDAEDGWDMMQDVWIVRNKFMANGRNDLLTCAGHNFIFEENEAALHLWNRTNSYVVRNNKFSSAFYGCGSRTRTSYPRVENNTYTKRVRFGDKNHDGWWMTVKDLDNAPSFSCGPGGAVLGKNITGTQLKSPIHLRDGKVSDSEVSFGGCIFANCTLSNLTGPVNGLMRLEDCTVKNLDSMVHGGGETLLIKKSRLSNVTWKAGNGLKPVTMIFEDCVIDNKSEPLLAIAAGAIKELRFVNCEFEGKAPVIKINDLRSSETDDEPGTVVFERCTVKKNSGYVVEFSGQNNNKQIAFSYKGELKCKFMPEKLPFAWTSRGGGSKKTPAAQRNNPRKKDPRRPVRRR